MADRTRFALMRRLPANLKAYRRTDTFTEHSVPAGLLKSHVTKTGTWAKIVVTKGRLLLRIIEPPTEVVELGPGTHCVVEPGVEHHVEPLGAVEFYVEFYR